MRKALILIAGETFQNALNIESIQNVRRFIFQYMQEKGLSPARWIIYLAPERFNAAPLFLQAGFEIFPADQESYQIALSCAFEINSANPPDEIIVSFGGKVPDRILPYLEERITRTLLISRQETTENVALFLNGLTENCFNIAPLLTGQSVPMTLPSSPKTVQTSSPSPSAAPAPLAEQKATVPPAVPQGVVKTPPSSQNVSEKPSEIQKDVQKTIISQDVLKESPASLEKSETLFTSQNDEKNVPFSVEDLRVAPQTGKSALIPPLPLEMESFATPFASVPSQIPDEISLDRGKTSRLASQASSLTEEKTDEADSAEGIEGFAASHSLTPEWTAAIQELVAQNGGKIAVSDLLNQVKIKFPVFASLGDCGGLLKALLPPNLRTLEDEGTAYIYASDHPDLKPISSEQAAQQLHFGNNLSNNAISIEIPANYVTEFHFDKICQKAAFLKEYYRKRGRSGKESQDSSPLKRTEDDFLREAQDLNVHVFNDALSESIDFPLFANCYEILEIAARLMNKGVNEEFGQAIKTEELGQKFADAVCLLKSALLSFERGIYDDALQVEAFDTINHYARNAGIFLKNLKREDTLNLQDTEGMKKSLLDLEKELTAPKDLGKKKKSLIKKINYHLDKIKEHLPGALHDWGRVVEGITSLAEDYKLPYSSKEYRTFLDPFIDKIPEEVEQTETFIRIVQNIEITNEPTAAQKASALPTQEAKLSPAVRKVRKNYKGSKIVFIGGTPMDHIIKRIQDAFQAELIWKESDHGDSIDRYLSVLNDENVKLFLVYIPWCSHKHSEKELPRLAKEYGKDFVRIPKGTNPEVIAAAICEQMRLNEKAN